MKPNDRVIIVDRTCGKTFVVSPTTVGYGLMASEAQRNYRTVIFEISFIYEGGKRKYDPNEVVDLTGDDGDDDVAQNSKAK